MKRQRWLAIVMLVSMLGALLFGATQPVSASIRKPVVTDNVFTTAEDGFYGAAIQKVLQGANSPMSKFKQAVNGDQVLASELFWLASQQEDFGMNPKSLLVTSFVESALDAPLPGYDLFKALRDMAQKLWGSYQAFGAGERNITLSNGSTIQATDDLNAATYALAVYFGQRSKDENELNNYLGQWSQAYWSLFQTDPLLGPINIQADPTPVEPFLILPFKQPVDNFFKINSFFDHARPGIFDDSVLRFDGKTVSPSTFNTCILGVSCYGGHNALDYSLPMNTALYAAAAGKVIYKDGSNGAVIIDHENGYRTLYWHQDIIYVDVGQVVTQGQVIGESGNRGQSSGPHLHFGLRLTSGSKDVDPYGWWADKADPWGGSLWMWKSGPISDNRDSSSQLFYRSYWNRETAGYNGESWWTNSVNNANSTTNWGIFGTYIPAAGSYDVYGYWPQHPENTTSATYKVFHSNGMSQLVVNQAADGNRWVYLGTFPFTQGGAVVIQTDVTADAPKHRVYFDAIRWEAHSVITPTPTKPTKTPTPTTSPYKNVALGKSASQSSRRYTTGGGPNLAVDGKTNGNYTTGSVILTNSELYSWWQVDLGASYDIASMAIWNRSDLKPERLKNYYIFLSEQPFDTRTPQETAKLSYVKSIYVTDSTGFPSHFSSIGTRARYVRVQYDHLEALSLAEVQVFASGGPYKNVTPTPTSTGSKNIALGKRAVQSSRRYSNGGGPNLAVDGNTNGRYTSGSVMLTNSESNAWWQVDLGGYYDISEIVIWNRSDLKPERLKNYYVFLSGQVYGKRTPQQIAALSWVKSYYMTDSAGFPTRINNINFKARYIRIMFDHKEALSMAEVQVFTK